MALSDLLDGAVLEVETSLTPTLRYSFGGPSSGITDILKPRIRLFANGQLILDESPSGPPNAEHRALLLAALIVVILVIAVY